jgi:hypothetical protein
MAVGEGLANTGPLAGSNGAKGSADNDPAATGDGISKENDRNPSRFPWIDRSGDKELGSVIGGR